MRGSKTITRLGSIFTILLAAGVILAGCATAINYSYDPATSFAGLKSYNWATAGSVSQTNDLVMKNVQYQADQVLEKEGLYQDNGEPRLADLDELRKRDRHQPVRVPAPDADARHSKGRQQATDLAGIGNGHDQ